MEALGSPRLSWCCESGAAWFRGETKKATGRWSPAAAFRISFYFYYSELGEIILSRLFREFRP
jgi:hypothetical protein